MQLEIKPDLSAKAVEIVTQIQESVRTGTNLAAEQIPEIAKEFIYYTIVSNSINIIVGSVGIYTSYKLLLKGKEIFSKCNPDDIFEAIAILLGGTTAFVVGVHLLLTSIHPLLLAIFAPKLLILKEIVNFVR